MSPPTSQFASTPHGRIRFSEAGAGPPLLMIHSSPNSHRDFAAVTPLLTDRYRVIAPDTLGFGESDEIPPSVTMETLADSMAALLDSAGIAKAHVYGFHTGNKIAAALAEGHSGRVDRLILAGMTHSLIDDKVARDAAIAPFAEKFFASPPPQIRRRPGSGEVRRRSIAPTSHSTSARPFAKLPHLPCCWNSRARPKIISDIRHRPWRRR